VGIRGGRESGRSEKGGGRKRESYWKARGRGVEIMRRGEGERCTSQEGKQGEGEGGCEEGEEEWTGDGLGRGREVEGGAGLGIGGKERRGKRGSIG